MRKKTARYLQRRWLVRRTPRRKGRSFSRHDSAVHGTTREDIFRSRYDHFSHAEHAFSAVLHEICYLIFEIPESHTPNSIPLSSIIHSMIIACYDLGEIWNEFGPLPFHLPLFQAKRTLNCPEAIGRHPSGESYPFFSSDHLQFYERISRRE